MKIIKSFFALLLASSLAHFSMAQTMDAGGFQQFNIGDIEAVVLTDGHIFSPTIQPVIAPGIPAEQVAEVLKSTFATDNSADLALNVLLLKKGDKLILIDGGQNTKSDDNGGWLVKNLQKIGITPDQITDILLTHAHPDHIGGLIDANGKSVYPHACIHMSKVEYDFWTSGKPDFSKSKLPADGVQGIAQFINDMIEIIKPQLELVESGDTILDFIRVDVVPGHTKGHLVSTVSSNGNQLVLIADLVHHPLLFAHPEWGIIFDYNFDEAVQSRISTLRKLHSNKSLIFGYHLPYPGIGHIRAMGTDSYEWIPAGFATPQRAK